MVSGEGKDFELVVAASDEEWLEIRKLGVGGSDVAAIMGLSRYRSPFSVYAEKTGLYKPEDISGNPAVHWGTVLEPVVGAEYARNHPDREVRRVDAVCRSLKRPWAQASLDFEVRDPELGWGVLEIKTAGWRMADDWADGVPVYYQTQVAHYMDIVNRPFADVAVLIGGQDYREFRIMRDEEDIVSVRSAVDAFWIEHVLKKNPPDVMAVDCCALTASHQDPPSDLDDLNESPFTLRNWIDAKNKYEIAKENKELWDARLKAEIGDSKGWSTPDGRITWVRSKRKRLDTKTLYSDMPEVKEKYMVESVADGGLRWIPTKPE